MGKFTTQRLAERKRRLARLGKITISALVRSSSSHVICHVKQKKLPCRGEMNESFACQQPIDSDLDTCDCVKESSAHRELRHKAIHLDL